jgi:small-conductance mechanosensitive channel
MATPLDFLVRLVNETITTFQQNLFDAVPRLLMGLIFLTLAYVGIRLALRVVRGGLDAVYPAEQDLIVSLGTTVVSVFLWFATILALLKIVGMGDIAASLGTATGFIALGISYALSNMIADTVAGVYLLRDPDFNPGDTVTADGVTGTVRSIELRKSRIDRDDGDTVVLANRDVEKKWTLETDEPESGDAEPA